MRRLLLRHVQPCTHVVYPHGSVGLINDYRVLTSALQQIGRPTLDFPFHGSGPRSKRFWLHRATTPDLWVREVSTNVFLERIVEGWLGRARTDVFVPNAEWLKGPSRALLPRIDLVLCKTKLTQTIFDDLGCRTFRIGFTSIDRAREAGREATPDFSHYVSPRPLHVGGSTSTKGTCDLLEVWARHPEWPVLTVVERGAAIADFSGPCPPNVRLMKEFVAEEHLAELMCDHNVHLCPSECEGFGHTVVEGMSAAAAILTVDGPPMNELVGPDRGVLVPPRSREALRAGMKFQVSLDALESGILTLLEADAGERAAMGLNSRRWFEANHVAFMSAVGQIFTGREGLDSVK